MDHYQFAGTGESGSSSAFGVSPHSLEPPILSNVTWDALERNKIEEQAKRSSVFDEYLKVDVDEENDVGGPVDDEDVKKLEYIMFEGLYYYQYAKRDFVNLGRKWEAMKKDVADRRKRLMGETGLIAKLNTTSQEIERIQNDIPKLEGEKDVLREKRTVLQEDARKNKNELDESCRDLLALKEKEKEPKKKVGMLNAGITEKQRVNTEKENLKDELGKKMQKAKAALHVEDAIIDGFQKILGARQGKLDELENSRKDLRPAKFDFMNSKLTADQIEEEESYQHTVKKFVIDDKSIEGYLSLLEQATLEKHKETRKDLDNKHKKAKEEYDKANQELQDTQKDLINLMTRMQTYQGNVLQPAEAKTAKVQANVKSIEEKGAKIATAINQVDDDLTHTVNQLAQEEEALTQNASAHQKISNKLDAELKSLAYLMWEANKILATYKFAYVELQGAQEFKEKLDKETKIKPMAIDLPHFQCQSAKGYLKTNAGK